MSVTKVVIVGLGNIGQGVLSARSLFPDIEVTGIFSRRAAEIGQSVDGVRVYALNKGTSLEDFDADVAILCGGSRTDLPEWGPRLARNINTVDSFDTHDHVGPWNDSAGNLQIGYLAEMHEAASHNGFLADVGIGWDPGLFSNRRAEFTACLGKETKVYAFYGLTARGGLSMGHSDAIRRVKHVADARSYTHARPEAIELVRSGANPHLSHGEMHWRECFVAVEPWAVYEDVQQAIVSMPNYFAPYETKVHFVDRSVIYADHQEQYHDGLVLAVSDVGLMEYRNVWHSNPQATARIMLATARAVERMNDDGRTGAITALDIPAKFLCADMGQAVSLV
ncbi:MAG: diaminopimelate dehydrogenase [Candidatus Paceibacterota bacterium]|jgi:diaminopimelate dehydrogenase